MPVNMDFFFYKGLCSFLVEAIQTAISKSQNTFIDIIMAFYIILNNRIVCPSQLYIC